MYSITQQSKVILNILLRTLITDFLSSVLATK